MALFVEHLCLTNVVFAVLVVFMIYLLVEFYQFRGMPPGPRLTNLPFIGNLFSFDFDATTFQDAVVR